MVPFLIDRPDGFLIDRPDGFLIDRPDGPLYLPGHMVHQISFRRNGGRGLFIRFGWLLVDRSLPPLLLAVRAGGRR